MITKGQIVKEIDTVVILMQSFNEDDFDFSDRVLDWMRNNNVKYTRKLEDYGTKLRLLMQYSEREKLRNCPELI